MKNKNKKETEEITEEDMKLMEVVSQDEIDEFVDNQNEDVEHILGVDLENVDNITKNPFEL